MGVVVRVEVVAREEDTDSASDEFEEAVPEEKEDSEDVRERLRSLLRAGREEEKGEEGRRAETRVFGSRIMLAEVREVLGEE